MVYWNLIISASPANQVTLQRRGKCCVKCHKASWRHGSVYKSSYCSSWDRNSFPNTHVGNSQPLVTSEIWALSSVFHGHLFVYGTHIDKQEHTHTVVLISLLPDTKDLSHIPLIKIAIVLSIPVDNYSLPTPTTTPLWISFFFPVSSKFLQEANFEIISLVLACF